jgi:hypothetical protein
VVALLSAGVVWSGLNAGTPAGAAPPGPPDRPVTTSVHASVAFSLAVPLADGTQDQVDLAGEIHVVTHVTLGETETTVGVYANLHNVRGVGSLSGLTYLGLGAANLDVAAPPGPPEVDPFVVEYRLTAVGHPPNPNSPLNPVTPLPVQITLGFSADAPGTLLTVEAVLAGDVVGP